jgi:hypothetical protein
MLGGAPVFGGKNPSTKLPSIGHYWTLSTALAFRHKRSTTLIHSFMLNQGREPTDLVPSMIGQQYIQINSGSLKICNIRTSSSRAYMLFLLLL